MNILLLLIVTALLLCCTVTVALASDARTKNSDKELSEVQEERADDPAVPSETPNEEDKTAAISLVADSCDRCPVCDFPKSRMDAWQPRCLIKFGVSSMPSTDEILHCLKWHLAALVGQTHVVDPVMNMLRRKLKTPSWPLVLHFCGDNGVGKSYLAKLISQAFSLRGFKDCANKYECSIGDSMLSIAAVAYSTTVDDKHALEQATEIWAKVAAHLRHYPHGIILLDDLAILSVKVRDHLVPMFSGAMEQGYRMPGHPDVNLANAIMIITSDFRAKGYVRTQYTTVDDLNNAIHAEVKQRYGDKVGRDMVTLGFWGLEEEDIEALVLTRIRRLKCLNDHLTGVTITQEALEWFVGSLHAQEHRMIEDSGRYVDQTFVKKVENLVVAEVEEEVARAHEYRLFVTVVLKPAHVDSHRVRHDAALALDWITEEERQARQTKSATGPKTTHSGDL